MIEQTASAPPTSSSTTPWSPSMSDLVAAAFVAAFHIPPPGDIPGQAEIPLNDETLER